ncbi:cardiolipin synthase [Blochmannia endosymbiont of Camponotus sp. C-046]|uniref:cardiolipin synthase n=1 Tax=Blochmannia endosymbiont of Camponotus sp. C-046 TaxID=2945589 RepID=UPI0020252BD1|nr:cardiolipin synthase [Blochmannia endosymbiont of Camponotus sp. C-046]URJ28865.1 cardiolipin synthase [Blochmannia endosymbiont of Camponotus sp. C-046]
MIAIHAIFNCIFLCSYWLLIVLVTFRVLIKRRAVPSSMAWLLVIYILPLIGIITYLLFGESNLGKPRSTRSKIAWSSTMRRIQILKTYKHIFSTEHSLIASSLFKLCEHRQGIGALRGNQIQLFKKTDDTIVSLIKDIELAQHSIDMIFYIWESGGLVDHVIKKLIIAAKRGIRCRIILDSAGCTNFFSSSYPNIMRQAGVNIVEALHINLLRIFLRRMDLRQHRKMILIDDHIAYTGSMNMVDPQLFKKNIGIGQWVDIMVRIDGPAASAMSIIFSSDWEIETGQHVLFPLLFNAHIVTAHKLIPTGHTIQIIPSGPGCPEGIIHQVLLISLYEARKKLIITTPYLVPSDDLLHAICTAAQRGVEVHIIIPQNNDSVLVNWASRAFFSELLKAGVLIHQFQNGLLHVKSVLVDQQLSLIGTVNLDTRSLWLNFEITLVIDSKDFSNELEKTQETYIAHSKIIDPQKWAKRPYWERIVERLFYFFSPLL